MKSYIFTLMLLWSVSAVAVTKPPQTSVVPTKTVVPAKTVVPTKTVVPAKKHTCIFVYQAGKKVKKCKTIKVYKKFTAAKPPNKRN
jgi:hypothetical protein